MGRRFTKRAEPRHASPGGRRFDMYDAIAASGRHTLAWSGDVNSPWEGARLAGSMLQLHHAGSKTEGSIRALDALLSPFSGLTRSTAFQREIMVLMKHLNTLACIISSLANTPDEEASAWAQVGVALRTKLADTYGGQVMVAFTRAAIQEASDARINTAPVVVAMPGFPGGGGVINQNVPLNPTAPGGLFNQGGNQLQPGQGSQFGFPNFDPIPGRQGLFDNNQVNVGGGSSTGGTGTTGGGISPRSDAGGLNTGQALGSAIGGLYGQGQAGNVLGGLAEEGVNLGIDELG